MALQLVSILQQKMAKVTKRYLPAANVVTQVVQSISVAAVATGAPPGFGEWKKMTANHKLGIASSPSLHHLPSFPNTQPRSRLCGVSSQTPLSPRNCTELPLLRNPTREYVSIWNKEDNKYQGEGGGVKEFWHKGKRDHPKGASPQDLQPIHSQQFVFGFFFDLKREVELDWGFLWPQKAQSTLEMTFRH